MGEAKTEENPLLDASGLPRFDAIEAEHVVPAIRAILAELATEFDALESDCSASWP